MSDFTVKHDNYVVYRDPHTRQVYLNNLDGKTIFGPYPARYNVFFCGNAVIFQTALNQNNEQLFEVNSVINDKKNGFPILCNNIRLLDNGNLVLNTLKEGANVVIYDPNVGKTVSSFFDSIGEFSHSVKDDKYFAIARVDVDLGEEYSRGKIHFFGKIDACGNLISPLFNSITEEMVIVNCEDSSFCDEIDKTKDVIKKKKLEKNKKIDNLPFVEPYKLY